MPHRDLERRLDLARAAAYEAGQITLRHFNSPGLAVELKSDQTPVTAADRASEEHLRRKVAEVFPHDGILGEEFGEQPGTSGFRWIFDPIDGTKSFIHGVPLYGTLVGVEHDGQCVAGVIYLPALDEMLYAAVGGGAWHVRGAAEAVQARVSTCQKLSDALFCTSEVITFYKVGREQAYLNLQNAARLARTWGDCYGYLLVATGRADLMVDPQMSVWDAGAIKPIIEEAGGTFTDWQGQPRVDSGDGIATCGGILDEVLAFTRS